MKKILTLLVTIIICIGLSTVSLAQGKDSKFSIISISKEAKTKLKTVQTIAIFFSGNDSLLVRIGEDVFNINLTNAGFTVINREVLEKAIGEEIAKKRKKKTGGSVNALIIGKAVNADSILTGTIITESGEEKLGLVRIASFQLVDVSTGKTLINIFFESEKGKSFSEIANRFVVTLKQSME